MNTEQQAFLKGLHRAHSGEYIRPVMERYDLSWLQAQQLVTLWLYRGCPG